MDLGDWPPFYSLSVVLRAGTQHPTNRIGAFVDEANSLLWTDLCTSVFPSSPSLPGEKNTVCSVSLPGALHKHWDQTACTLAAQPRHPNPELMVSTRLEGLPSLEDGLGTLSCARLLLQSTELFFHVLSSKQWHSRWWGWYQTSALRAGTKSLHSQPLQKLSPAAKAGVWFAGCEEEREQDHCYRCSGSERGPKLYFFLRLRIFVSLNKNKRSSKKTKMGRGKRVPVYNCWRGQRNGFSNGNVTVRIYSWKLKDMCTLVFEMDVKEHKYQLKCTLRKKNMHTQIITIQTKQSSIPRQFTYKCII